MLHTHSLLYTVILHSHYHHLSSLTSCYTFSPIYTTTPKDKGHSPNTTFGSGYYSFLTHLCLSTPFWKPNTNTFSPRSSPTSIRYRHWETSIRLLGDYPALTKTSLLSPATAVFIRLYCDPDPTLPSTIGSWLYAHQHVVPESRKSLVHLTLQDSQLPQL